MKVLRDRTHGGLSIMTEELQVVSETIEVVSNGTEQLMVVEEEIEAV
jgi:hypothetical protein